MRCDAPAGNESSLAHVPSSTLFLTHALAAWLRDRLLARAGWTVVSLPVQKLYDTTTGEFNLEFVERKLTLVGATLRGG